MSSPIAHREGHLRDLAELALQHTPYIPVEITESVNNNSDVSELDGIGTGWVLW